MTSPRRRREGAAAEEQIKGEEWGSNRNHTEETWDDEPLMRHSDLMTSLKRHVTSCHNYRTVLVTSSRQRHCAAWEWRQQGGCGELSSVWSEGVLTMANLAQVTRHVNVSNYKMSVWQDSPRRFDNHNPTTTTLVTRTSRATTLLTPSTSTCSSQVHQSQ